MDIKRYILLYIHLLKYMCWRSTVQGIGNIYKVGIRGRHNFKYTNMVKGLNSTFKLNAKLKKKNTKKDQHVILYI